MIFDIVLGFIIWLVLPLVVQGWLKQANLRKAVAMLCKIIGIAVIVIAVWDEIKTLF